MKKILLATLVVGGVLWATVSQAQLTLAITGQTGSEIQFSGPTFTITGGANQWLIGPTTGGTGSANGLYGNFSGGPWSIGAITTTTPVVGVTEEDAPVTTAGGTLTINDGAGYLLTGTVNWMQVQTINSGGSLNASALVNVTALAYSGLNADLLTLAQGDGSVTLAFQFAPGEDLTTLISGGGPYSTSYNGSITSVPVPEATTMIAGALLLLPFGASTLRILRKARTA